MPGVLTQQLYMRVVLHPPAVRVVELGLTEATVVITQNTLNTWVVRVEPVAHLVGDFETTGVK